MRDKFLIGIFAFFASIITIILILNFSSSDTNSGNDFDRKFSDNDILLFDKTHKWLGNENTYELFNSNFTSIVEGKFNGFTDDAKTIECNLIFSDCSFSSVKSKRVTLPNSNVLLIDKNQIVYSHKFDLYKLDLYTNLTYKSNLKDINIFSIINLENSPNKYLFFGGAIINRSYKIGFFVIDLVNSSIVEIKTLHSNYFSYNLELAMMYSGRFQKTVSNAIVYTCERNSNIFLFNDQGKLNKIFLTKDNTPMPKVIRDSKNNCYFSADNEQYTNAGVFMDRKNLFVFSMASKIEDEIIIDQYSLKTSQYIQSFKLDFEDKSVGNVIAVIMCQDKIILRLDSFNYASFKFSRYIDGNFY